jgi:flagellar basal-body rod protein FlgB
MFISTLTQRGAGPALEATLKFQHERLKVVAENVANFGTPGYRARQLDTKGFQRALGMALKQRGADPRNPLVIEAGREARTDDAGRLVVTPSPKPVENLLFHDGTNASLERQMSELAQAALTHRVATELLRGKFDGLRKAIRGTV